MLFLKIWSKGQGVVKAIPQFFGVFFPIIRLLFLAGGHTNQILSPCRLAWYKQRSVRIKSVQKVYKRGQWP